MLSKEGDALGFRVLRSLRRILRRVSRHSRAVGKETGLAVAPILCLRAVDQAEVEEVTVAWVSNAVHLSKSTVSPMVQKLVSAGLLTRRRSERDRRRVCLAMTDEGRARLASTPEPLEAQFLARLAALEDGERESILIALERVVELMDADSLDASPVLVPGDEVAAQARGLPER